MVKTLTKRKQEFSLTNKMSIVIENLNDTTKVVNKVVDIATSHIVCIDVSGSMWDSLKNIRKELKNKITNIIKETDDLTIIYFSGSDMCGSLFEEYSITNLSDLTKVHSLIDRYLSPQGLTSFYNPLLKVKEVIGNIKSHKKDNVISIFYVSDGYTNSGKPKSDILSLCKELEPLVNASTIVGFGDYCDSTFLGTMAEKMGGQYLDSEDFASYQPIFEASMSKRLLSTKKKEITLPSMPLHGIVVSISNDNDITVFGVDDNKTILVPEDTERITYITESKVQTADDTLQNYVKVASQDTKTYAKDLQAVYGMISVLAQRFKSQDVYAILESFGDKEVAFKYCNAFGKQNLAKFNALVLLKVKLQDAMFKDGFDLNAVPPSNSYCIISLFEDLMDDEEAKWYPQHEAFVYNRIGAKTKNVASILTDEDKAQIKDLSEKLSKATDVNEIKAINDGIKAITNSKVDLNFTIRDKTLGYPINKLVWHEDRPNLSVSVRYEGFVELPENEFNIKSVDTFIIRTNTIVKSGNINVDVFPISVSEATHTKLVNEGLVQKTDVWAKGKIFLVNLRKKLTGEDFPVVNRDMVKSVSAKDVFEKSWQQEELKASQKVFGHYEKQLFPKVSTGLIESYGVEATTWLNSLGISDSLGFAPKTLPEYSGDVYDATELVVSIKSYSALPSIKAVETKLGSGKKLTASDELINKYLKEYNSFIESDIYKKSANQTHLLETWLTDKKKDSTEKLRSVRTALSKTKFSIILSQQWFDGFDDMDNTVMTIPTPDGFDIVCQAKLGEKSEKV